MWIVITEKYDTINRKSNVKYFKRKLPMIVHILISKIQGKRVSIIKE